jgi:hypothetical protein
MERRAEARYRRLMSQTVRRTDAEPLPDDVVTVRMELVDTDPLVWREVVVPTSATLKVLHEVIQVVMNWFDYHLWEFEIGGHAYGVPMEDDWRDEPMRDAAKTRLRDVLGTGATKIGYTYDFGDNWEMRLVARDRREGEFGRYPLYVGGERNAPPEDCGGVGGFYALLEALADEDHPDHDEVAEAFDGYDPEAVDEEGIRYGLLRLARARKGGRRPSRRRTAAGA